MPWNRVHLSFQEARRRNKDVGPSSYRNQSNLAGCLHKHLSSGTELWSQGPLSQAWVGLSISKPSLSHQCNGHSASTTHRRWGHLNKQTESPSRVRSVLHIESGEIIISLFLPPPVVNAWGKDGVHGGAGFPSRGIGEQDQSVQLVKEESAEGPDPLYWLPPGETG